jgi:hypothetical protein
MKLRFNSDATYWSDVACGLFNGCGKSEAEAGDNAYKEGDPRSHHARESLGALVV